MRTIPNRIELCEYLTKSGGETRIKLTFRPKVLRNYQNVFQTSNGNAGIRLEIDENGGIGAIVGIADGGFIAAGNEGRAEVGRESTASIRIVSTKGVYLKVDDAEEVHTPGVPSPICDRILLGAGFDETRVFEGTSSSKMTAGTSKYLLPARKLLRVIGQFLLFGAFLIWSLRDESADVPGDDKAESDS